MKVLRHLIFMAIVIIGFSMTAAAQKQDDNQNRPPKDPPKIVPPDKDRPRDRPRDDNNNNNRPKKPQTVIFISGKQIEISTI